MEETKKKVGEEERKESWIDMILQDNILAFFCSGVNILGRQLQPELMKTHTDGHTCDGFS